MLNCFRFRLTKRRLRLFVIAWCRVCGLDTDEDLQRALDASERYADERASLKELLSARMALYRIIQSHPRRDEPARERAELVYAAAGRQGVTVESATYRLDRLSQYAVKLQAARILRDMVNIQCLQPSVSVQGQQRFGREQGWISVRPRPGQPCARSAQFWPAFVPRVLALVGIPPEFDRHPRRTSEHRGSILDEAIPAAGF